MTIDQEGPAAGTPATSDRRARRLVVRALLAVAALFVIAYGILFALAGDRVPRGTTVEGVAIGGLEPDAAEKRLQEALEPRTRTPIVFTADGTRHSVDPSDAGLSVDYAATVAKAGGGRSLMPTRLWKHYLGSPEVDTVIEVEETSMDAALSSLAEAFDVPAVEGSVTFEGGVATPVTPRDGRTVDADQAREALEDHFLHDRTVEVPRSSEHPAVDQAAVDRAMQSFAVPAMSGPVTIRFEGDQVDAPPSLFGQALSMTAQDGELVPAVDGTKLATVLQGKLPAVGKKPRDATFRIVDGRPKLVPAKSVVTFDPADLEAKFSDVLVRPAGERVVEVGGTVVQPEFTTD